VSRKETVVPSVTLTQGRLALRMSLPPLFVWAASGCTRSTPPPAVTYDESWFEITALDWSGAQVGREIGRFQSVIPVRVFQSHTSCYLIDTATRANGHR
jgi:hypothetical protein